MSSNFSTFPHISVCTTALQIAYLHRNEMKQIISAESRILTNVNNYRCWHDYAILATANIFSSLLIDLMDTYNWRTLCILMSRLKHKEHTALQGVCHESTRNCHRQLKRCMYYFFYWQLLIFYISATSAESWKDAGKRKTYFLKLIIT